MNGTPECPVYAYLPDPTRAEHAIAVFMITVDEGWRSSILCDGMYEWAARWLVDQLQGKPFAPEHRP